MVFQLSHKHPQMDEKFGPTLSTSSRSQTFFKICVFENLKKNTRVRKTPALESLFSKVADLKTCNLIKKRLEHIENMNTSCEY